MNQLVRILIFLVLVTLNFYAFGQMAEYGYKRELKGVTDQWHKIILPNGLFGKTSQNLSDIRIYGITESNDTIEAPFLQRLTTEKIASKEVAFQTINTSYNNKGYYFTFEIPTIEPINQIKLDFEQENFDWRIKLEGSQDQNEWFTVVEDYRILSIKNNQTDFRFTKLTFPSSKYRYFRVFIGSKEQPKLSIAKITQNDVTDGTFRKYSVKQFKVRENKQSKRTEIEVELQLPVRASRIHINVSDTFDYYRPVAIQYQTDSFKTEQGWKYNFNTLVTGKMNSIEKNEWRFSSTTVQKLKIYIDNYDNQPLTIDGIEVKGYIHELVARFSAQASYYLAYGNKRASRPNYDIKRFTANIPETLTALDLDPEQVIEKDEKPEKSPLFENKSWLWAIMILIIGLLGWFTAKMMRGN